MSPTRRGALVAAVAALSGTVLPAWVALAAVAAVVVAIGVDAWQVRRPPEVTRTVPAILSRGVPAPLLVTAPSPTTALHQPSGPDVEVEPREAHGTLTATVTAGRRGRHELGPVATRTVGPLGLGCWYHRTGPTTTVVVYPDLPAARRIALEVRHGRFTEEGTRTRGPLGLGTDFESIREYRPDDDIRQVNWKATARTGTPMSNQFRVERDREVVCLVDSGRLMAGPAGDRTRLDAAVDVVAALAAVVEEVGDRIGVVVFADRVRRTVPPRRGGAALVLEAVHDVEPVPVDSDYELAFRAVSGSRRAFVLILTDLLDRAAGAPLEAAVPILSRHHEVAVAGAVDADLQRLLDSPAVTVDEALRTAVAVDLLDERRGLTSALRRAGAEVIEAGPESLAARCTAAYLTARRRARL